MKKILLCLVLLPMVLLAQNDNPTTYLYKWSVIPKESAEASSNLDQIGDNRFETIDYEFTLGSAYAVLNPVVKLNNTQAIGKIDFAQMTIDENGVYDYDLTNSVFYNTKEFNGKKISVKYDYNYLDWKFEDAQEIINGYHCKKAVYSRTYTLRNDQVREYTITVWYADVLNPHLAPFGLTGLPGGIVKINYNDYSEVLFAGEISSKKKRKIKPNKLGQIISKETYDIMLEEYVKNFQLQRENRGVDKD